MNKAFTLVELIFVIIIIGVLSAVAIPQFSKLTDNSKISAELATASSIQTAIEACHGEWVISDSDIICGKDINSSSDFSAEGYPKNDSMGSAAGSPIDRILKNAETSKWKRSGINYYGPASDTVQGTNHCKTGKPCIGKRWEYNEATGEFKLVEN